MLVITPGDQSQGSPLGLERWRLGSKLALEGTISTSLSNNHTLITIGTHLPWMSGGAVGRELANSTSSAAVIGLSQIVGHMLRRSMAASKDVTRSEQKGANAPPLTSCAIPTPARYDQTVFGRKPCSVAKWIMNQTTQCNHFATKFCNQ